MFRVCWSCRKRRGWPDWTAAGRRTSRSCRKLLVTQWLTAKVLLVFILLALYGTNLLLIACRGLLDKFSKKEACQNLSSAKLALQSVIIKAKVKALGGCVFCVIFGGFFF